MSGCSDFAALTKADRLKSVRELRLCIGCFKNHLKGCGDLRPLPIKMYKNAQARIFNRLANVKPGIPVEVHETA